MPRYWECRACRALLTRERLEATAGVCPYCDARVGDPAEFSDPDAPPAEHEAGGRRFDPIDAPATLPEKLATAFRILFEQFPLFAALVLVVRLPANALLEAAITREPALADDIVTLVSVNTAVMLLLGPFTSAAVIVALSERMSGRSIDFLEAVRAGAMAWSRVFAARLLALLIILAVSAGAVLAELPPILRLVLLVPGIILTIRWCLIDEVVVLEETSVMDSRRRSADLVAGRALRIVGGSVVVLSLVGMFAIFMTHMVNEAGARDEPAVRAIVGSLINVFEILHPIVIFLFYWEARADLDARTAFKPAFEEERV